MAHELKLLTFDFEITTVRENEVMFQLSPFLQARRNEKDAICVPGTTQGLEIIRSWARQHKCSLTSERNMVPDLYSADYNCVPYTIKMGDLASLPHIPETGVVEPCSWDREFFRNYDIGVLQTLSMTVSFLEMGQLKQIIQQITSEKAAETPIQEHVSVLRPHRRLP